MKVLNFGSLNVDYVYQVDHIMLPGETQSSTRRNVFAGGKGLNQSVALAKAGLPTYHAGQVGNDADGEMLLRVLERNGVDCSLVNRIDGPCGHTVIQVDKNAQNCILLFGGANRCIDAAYRKKVFSQFSAGDVIVLQNEINDLDQVIDEAYEKGMRIVLNPSPFDAYLDRCDWNKVDVFFINEVEGAQISGREAAEDILAWFREHHPKALVVLTLGGAGSCCMKDGQVYQQEIVPVKAVDTTAAGDTFTGFFLRAYLNGQTIPEALALAARASSVTVSRPGAADSIPTMAELES
ncbi:MAG: ribokinase [Clostridiales bacterium]|nr:ribokinase [Clostridiales bacterium]MDY4035797.1 ribokinase [Candidatus Pseudoscilispira sp.]